MQNNSTGNTEHRCGYLGKRNKMSKRLILLLLTSVVMFRIPAQTLVASQNIIIEPNILYGLTNPLVNEGSPMTYYPADVAAKGAAFSMDYNNQGGTDFDGYPSGKIGAVKAGGIYYPGNFSLCGMPVQIQNLDYNFRINWSTSQANANDVNDKWWATINVIFDQAAANNEPDPLARDFDLVIQHIAYVQDDLTDKADDGYGPYWYFARNLNGSIKPFTLYLNGQTYSWAVRYKFFNYPAGDPDEYQNDKVHIKFIPINNNDKIPFFDHPLKLFIDCSKDYIAFLSLTASELLLANQKVAAPALWIKTLAAGYEVYEGNSTLRNDYFFVGIDNSPPGTVSDLSCSKVGNNINLNWDDLVISDLDHYTVYRSVNAGAYSVLMDIVRESNWTDSDVVPGNTYSYVVTASDRSYNESQVSASCSLSVSSLPVVLISLEAHAVNGNYIQVKWETSSEINNKEFVVEKSFALNEWAEIARLPGGGYSASVRHYTVFDRNPSSGVNFYRLKDVSVDGKITYSKIVSERFDRSKSIFAYPNPTNDFINIEGLCPENIRILSATGYDVTSLVSIKNSRETVIADLRKLPAGLYFLKSNCKTLKVVKN